ncbi:MAG: LamG-like jellyroll fold domain-containing protein [Candidatus Jorgensenbacteria bacterium]|nr:LamG-like jellyroll fold domain-containing protein [Candidatus Jorgensenbacteria bacterium]
MEKNTQKKYMIHDTRYLIPTRFKACGGFTLIELLIVIGLMVILTVAGVAVMGRFGGSQNIKLTLRELSAAINDAKNRSIAQESGLAWGVHFINTTSSQIYDVFQGTSFSAGTTTNTYALSTRNVRFSNPYTSSTLDLAFAARTGALSSKKIVSIVTGAADAFMGDVIVNTRGSVTTRFESGMVGYWHFDEGTATTTYDASGQGNNGTATNSPTWASGSSCKAGGCLSFDGVSSYVSALTNSGAGANDAKTICAWVKRNTGVGGGIVSTRINYGGIDNTANGYIFTVTSDGNFWYSHTGHGDAKSTSAIDTSWHNICAVIGVNATTPKLYLDGTEETLSANTLAQANTETVGGYTAIGAQSTDYFSGSIDEVRIYKRALTAAEVLSMYNDLK